LMRPNPFMVFPPCCGIPNAAAAMPAFDPPMLFVLAERRESRLISGDGR
jgi:hypothetical protein